MRGRRVTLLLAVMTLGRARGQVFGPETGYAAGQSPIEVQVADFDGKLGPDLATANKNDGTVTIFFAKGDGTYDPAVIAATLTFPEELLVVDVDKDGQPDLVATSLGSGSGPQLIVLRNAAGTFASTTTTTAAFARALATSDFNRDGKADLASANENVDSVTVYTGNGSGAFTANGTYTVGDNPVAIAASDLDVTNGDDIVVAHTGGTDGVTVLINSGSGLFLTVREFPVTTGGNPVAVALADVDQSLGPDILTANSLTGDVSVLLSQGSGQFAAAQSYALAGGGYPDALSVVDLDDDSDLDVVVGQRTTRKITVLLGNGAGSFAIDPSSPYGVPLAPFGVVTADVDFDNAPDAVVALADGNNPSVVGQAGILRNLLGPFAPTVTTASLPDAVLGVAYSATLTGTGGSVPYAWDLAKGSLPSSLSLDALTGVISGTPTLFSIGTAYFTARVEDTALRTGIRPLKLRVVSPASVLVAKGSGSSGSYDQIVGGYRADGTPISALSFPAYSFAGYGARLGGGDLDGSELEEILAMPGPGPSHPPAVRGFDRVGSPIATVDFFAYGVLSYGGNVTAADIDDLLFSEILTGPGPGPSFGPQVRAFGYDGLSQPKALAKVNYYAYGTLNYGVRADALDADADGFSEILTGAGPGAVFGPHVRGWNYDGATLASMPGLSFFAYATLAYGVNAVGAELDGDARGEILTGAGPGYVFSAHVRGFQFSGAVSTISNLSAVVFVSRYGVNLAAADIDADGFSEVLAGPGPDPAAAAALEGFDYDGGPLTAIPALSLSPFSVSYGLRVGGLPLGY